MRKQSSDEEVQNIAKALIKSWKKLLGEVLSEDAALLHSYLNGNDQLHVVLQMVQRRRRRTAPLWGLHPPPKTLAAVRKGLCRTDDVITLSPIKGAEGPGFHHCPLALRHQTSPPARPPAQASPHQSPPSLLLLSPQATWGTSVESCWWRRCRPAVSKSSDL